MDVLLSRCDRDLLPLPGTIQPHGHLLVVDPLEDVVVRASAAIGLVAGGPGRTVLGASLDTVLDDASAARCRAHAQRPDSPPLIDPFAVRGRSGQSFEALVHLGDQGLVIELWPTPAWGRGEGGLGPLPSAIGHAARADSIEALCARAADTLADLTGYERVTVHRFTETWDSEVVAEARRGSLPSYLGQRFPSGNLKPSARALFTCNPVRLVPDVAYRPVDVLGSPPGGPALDMTYCTLRGISARQRRYLDALDVRAALSVALMVEGSLWGLIACHHAQPLSLSLAVLGACQVFAETVAQQIFRLENRSRARARARVAAVVEAVSGQLAQRAGMAEALTRVLGEIEGLFQANAAVVALDGRQGTVSGPLDGAPVEVGPGQKLLVSDQRPASLRIPDPLAADYTGIVFLPLSEDADKDFLLLGRPETVRILDWVGHPQDQAPPVADDSPDSDDPLLPAFGVWHQEVRGRSLSFSPLDREAAETLQLFLAERLGELRRRQAVDALEESRQRLRHLAECSSDWFWETDPHGTVTSVSELLKGLGDLRAEELIGQRFTELLGSGDDAGDESEVGDIDVALSQGHAFHGLTALLQIPGRGQWWVRLSGVPVLDASGAVLGFRGTGTNVTQLKALQEERLRAQRLEALGRMASGIAHEINNVLQPMLTMSYYAGKRIDDTAFVQSALADIEESGLRAREIVRAILAFARQTPSRRQPIDIARELGKAVEFARKGMPHLRVVTDIEPTQAQVLANVTELSQVMFNLLANANDAMESRGRATVALRTQAEVRRVRITVRDEGPGMDLDTRNRIFDPFFTTKPEGRGTGMGLAVVHGLVEAWGGTIGVESAPGLGTTFWISLPVTNAQQTEPR
ncbi:ATP-binding protein [Pararhodospirillum photometricum]|uniref:ATP-binding protein n=1 Tax=Pararhodospirillum photometricum TaxID=1084 RepID=UPI0002EE180A|nr:ATP-binding protein [Pararhodospirillum photometricum]